MRIGAHDTGVRVLIVAEIGNNHEGDAGVALELVKRAAAAGADAVKFQTFHTELFVDPGDAARFARLKSFELSTAELAPIAAAARSLGLLFLSTPLDVRSAADLEPLVDAYKIASGDLTFRPLLEAVATSGKPIVLSSGASTIGEVQQALAAIDAEWQRRGTRSEVAVLHCVSSYPVPESEANLRAIPQLAAACGVTIGYSDHVTGIEAAVVAVALGARIVEKHFTLNTHYSDFRDHQLSADPAAMTELVVRIRRVESMLGSGEKVLQPSERGMRDAIRRSAVLARDRDAGAVLTADDVSWQRPAGGLQPGDERALLGRRLRHAVRAGHRLSPSDCE